MPKEITLPYGVKANVMTNREVRIMFEKLLEQNAKELMYMLEAAIHGIDDKIVRRRLKRKLAVRKAKAKDF